MRPRCYNRPPAAAGTWELVGIHPVLGKPHYRWRPRWFEDRCTQHDGRGIGPGGENYAVAHGFDCVGCRWEPPHVRQAREFEARMRHGPVDKAVDKAKVIHISTPTGEPSVYARLVAGLQIADLKPVPLGAWMQHLPMDSADARIRQAWGADLIDPDYAKRVQELSAAAMASINFSATTKTPDDRL